MTTLALALALLSPSADPSETTRKELAALQGTWQLVSAETDGKKVPEEVVKMVRIVIQGSRHTVYIGDETVAKEVRFDIDPSRDPKTVDDTLDDGRVIRGIYELKGDTLRSCVAPPDKERPTEFAAKPGGGQTLRVFRRVSGETRRSVVVPKDETPFAVAEGDVVRLTGKSIAGSKIEAEVVAGPAKVEFINEVSQRAKGSPVIGEIIKEFEVRPSGKGKGRVRVTIRPPQGDVKAQEAVYEFEVK